MYYLLLNLFDQLNQIQICMLSLNGVKLSYYILKNLSINYFISNLNRVPKKICNVKYYCDNLFMLRGSKYYL
jgi:hypothetical protein